MSDKKPLNDEQELINFFAKWKEEHGGHLIDPQFLSNAWIGARSALDVHRLYSGLVYLLEQGGNEGVVDTELCQVVSEGTESSWSDLGYVRSQMERLENAPGFDDILEQLRNLLDGRAGEWNRKYEEGMDQEMDQAVAPAVSAVSQYHSGSYPHVIEIQDSDEEDDEDDEDDNGEGEGNGMDEQEDQEGEGDGDGYTRVVGWEDYVDDETEAAYLGRLAAPRQVAKDRAGPGWLRGG